METHHRLPRALLMTRLDRRPEALAIEREVQRTHAFEQRTGRGALVGAREQRLLEPTASVRLELGRQPARWGRPTDPELPTTPELPLQIGSRLPHPPSRAEERNSRGSVSRLSTRVEEDAAEASVRPPAPHPLSRLTRELRGQLDGARACMSASRSERARRRCIRVGVVCDATSAHPSKERGRMSPLATRGTRAQRRTVHAPRRAYSDRFEAGHELEREIGTSARFAREQRDVIRVRVGTHSELSKTRVERERFFPPARRRDAEDVEGSMACGIGGGNRGCSASASVFAPAASLVG